MRCPTCRTRRSSSAHPTQASRLRSLFDDRTDPYWARSRVVESLNQVQSRLPPGANAALGPDATGVGWIYEYALVDRTGTQDIGQLRALNDWFLKFELKTVPDVAEVASIGGMVRQYQVLLDPDRMRALGIAQATVVAALRQANQASGGSVVELAEAEYMLRSRGFLKSLDDFRAIPLALSGATPVLLRDVATVQIGRRCAAASPSWTAKARWPAAWW